jgi:hypothetical protein
MALAITLASGCANVEALRGSTTAERPVSGKGALLPGSDIRASGFLGDYRELKPVAGEHYLWRYQKPAVNWSAYDKVFVAPLEVWLNPESDQPQLQAELSGRVDRRFREILAKELQSHGYGLADRPEPGVLVFRGALTGVTPVRRAFEPVDALPVMIAVNAGKAALGAEPYQIVLSGEIEVLDGASGARVFAAVGARRGFQTTTKQSEITWAELEDIFAWVAQRWRQQLDRARQAATQAMPPGHRPIPRQS